MSNEERRESLKGRTLDRVARPPPVPTEDFNRLVQKVSRLESYIELLKGLLEEKGLPVPPMSAEDATPPLASSSRPVEHLGGSLPPVSKRELLAQRFAGYGSSNSAVQQKSGASSSTPVGSEEGASSNAVIPAPPSAPSAPPPPPAGTSTVARSTGLAKALANSPLVKTPPLISAPAASSVASTAPSPPSTSSVSPPPVRAVSIKSSSSGKPPPGPKPWTVRVSAENFLRATLKDICPPGVVISLVCNQNQVEASMSYANFGGRIPEFFMVFIKSLCEGIKEGWVSDLGPKYWRSGVLQLKPDPSPSCMKTCASAFNTDGDIVVEVKNWEDCRMRAGWDLFNSLPTIGTIELKGSSVGLLDLPSEFAASHGDIAESLQEYEDEGLQHLATIQAVVGLEIKPHLAFNFLQSKMMDRIHMSNHDRFIPGFKLYHLFLGGLVETLSTDCRTYPELPGLIRQVWTTGGITICDSNYDYVNYGTLAFDTFPDGKMEVFCPPSFFDHTETKLKPIGVTIKNLVPALAAARRKAGDEIFKRVQACCQNCRGQGFTQDPGVHKGPKRVCIWCKGSGKNEK